MLGPVQEQQVDLTLSQLSSPILPTPLGWQNSQSFCPLDGFLIKIHCRTLCALSSLFSWVAPYFSGPLNPKEASVQHTSSVMQILACTGHHKSWNWVGLLFQCYFLDWHSCQAGKMRARREILATQCFPNLPTTSSVSHRFHPLLNLHSARLLEGLSSQVGNFPLSVFLTVRCECGQGCT